MYLEHTQIGSDLTSAFPFRHSGSRLRQAPCCSSRSCRHQMRSRICGQDADSFPNPNTHQVHGNDVHVTRHWTRAAPCPCTAPRPNSQERKSRRSHRHSGRRKSGPESDTGSYLRTPSISSAFPASSSIILPMVIREGKPCGFITKSGHTPCTKGRTNCLLKQQRLD